MQNLTHNSAVGVPPYMVPTAQEIPPVDLAELFFKVWAGKWIIILCTAIAVLLAGYYAFAMTQPRYSATATLQISPSQKLVGDIETFAPIDPISINTKLQLFRSSHLLGQVVTSLNLLEDPEFNRYLTPSNPLSINSVRTKLRNLLMGQRPEPPNETAIMNKTIANLAGAISVNNPRNTYIFQISASSGDADKAAIVANALAELYLSDQIAARNAAADQAATWLTDQVYELQTQLEAKEIAINDLIASAPTPDPQSLDLLSQQAVETRTRLAETQAALIEAQTKLNMADEPTPLQADVRRYSAQASALQDFQINLETKLADRSAGLIQLQQLRREADTTRVLYQTFLARLQQTRIERDLQTADSRILSYASPGQYVAPRKSLILAIAALIGVVTGFIILAASHVFRQGFNNAQDLSQATGYKVLAQLPRLTKSKLKHLGNAPLSPMAEAIRQLRTALTVPQSGSIPKIILSTSSLPAEGKTAQSIALAQSFASIKKKTLLIEADLRTPALSRHIPCYNGPGLTAVIGGDIPLSQAVHHDVKLGADILPAGQILANPADIFALPDFGACLAKARESYDVIIIDAPPPLLATDTLLLVPISDVVVYNVRWQKTPSQTVLAGLEQLKDCGAKIAGLVLTETDLRKTQFNRATKFMTARQKFQQP